MSDVSYLNAKREIDDRALDRSVLRAFTDRLPDEPTILEVGAGTMTMPERLIEWGVIGSGRWVAVDSHAEAIEAGRTRLCSRPETVETEAIIRLGNVTIDPVVADVFEYVSDADERFDAVIGSAFFDIVDAERAVSVFRTVSDLLYAPITYDGETVFEPDDSEDDLVLERYEHHMREYRQGSPNGAATLSDALADVLIDQPSPWRIEPPYTKSEQIVLERLLETIENAVNEAGGDASEWVRRRRAQLAADLLRYRATNRDLLGRP